MEIDADGDDSRPAKRCKRVEVSVNYCRLTVHLLSMLSSYIVPYITHLFIPSYIATIPHLPLPPK